MIRFKISKREYFTTSTPDHLLLTGKMILSIRASVSIKDTTKSVVGRGSVALHYKPVMLTSLPSLGKSPH